MTERRFYEYMGLSVERLEDELKELDARKRRPSDYEKRVDFIVEEIRIKTLQGMVADG